MQPPPIFRLYCAAQQEETDKKRFAASKDFLLTGGVPTLFAKMNKMSSALAWVYSLPKELLHSAESHQLFEYTHPEEREECDLEMGHGPIPLGEWNAILHLAAQAGLYPDPQLLAFFGPLGRLNSFYYLDLPTLDRAFPGNGDLIVAGLNSWLNEQERWGDDLSECPSVVRVGQSVYTYFLNAVFELAPFAVRNHDILRAAARIATVEGRSNEFVAVFESLLASIYLPKNSIG